MSVFGAGSTEIFSVLAILFVLVFLEGILSVDNALVLAILARRVKPSEQKKVLTYGLVGAIVFRLIAVAVIGVLAKYTWVKLVGGAYLLFLAIQHFFFKAKAPVQGEEVKHAGFWSTVLRVELTDVAFAIDSILAAVAMTDKYWLVVTGGILGTVMMRFAANFFMKLLDRFSKLETTAFVLIAIVGIKILLEGFDFPGVDFHSWASPWTKAQWLLMIAAIVYGFIPKKPKKLA